MGYLTVKFNLSFLGFAVILILQLFASEVKASFSCRMTKLLAEKSLADNPEFWSDFAKLKHTDQELESLIRKYAPELLQSSPEKLAVSPKRIPFQVHHGAERALGKNKNGKIYKKYEEFLDLMTDPKRGLKDISTTAPGANAEGVKSGWHHKTLLEDKNKHTVRLDSGTRVLFEIRDGELHILDIGNHVTH